MKAKFFNKLSTRLIISISVILSLVLAINTYISITNLKSDLTRSRLLSAYNSSDIIKKSTRYSMLLNRRDDVHQIINTIGTEQGIIGIRVYNKSGIIAYSTDSTEISHKVSMTDEACAACHKSSGKIEELTSQNRIRYFTNPKDKKRVLGLINPIKNEEDCSTANCHAHQPSVKVLGVLDVMVSMAELDEAIDKNSKTTIMNSILITIVISAFCGLFIKVIVSKPLSNINKGIQEVGKGNLNYRIQISSKNELGNVARRFNDMSQKLDSAYKEIKDWSENLNQKVQQKSEELKNIYNQVIQIEKLASLGKLSATVAHELNNPLAGILTYSKLISKKLSEQHRNGENKKLIEYLDLIAGESSRCGKIVKDLLLFSHQSKGEFTEASLVDIINRCITLMHHHLEINGINLEKKFPEEEIIIKCSPEKIEEALIALLINAIEAMPNGGYIKIDLMSDSKSAILKISDEGIGIHDKDLPHIFEPFYSTKESTKGTGLGLAVVYGIIKNHNGEVNVEKTSPSGTIFKVVLPRNL
jgi:two-component system NtrC family sensor kinase